jgi:hypothetical protein
MQVLFLPTPILQDSHDGEQCTKTSHHTHQKKPYQNGTSISKNKFVRFYPPYIYIYIMEYYSAMEKNDLLSCAVKWIELETITLSEVGQVQKHKRHMFPVLCGK